MCIINGLWAPKPSNVAPQLHLSGLLISLSVAAKYNFSVADLVNCNDCDVIQTLVFCLVTTCMYLLRLVFLSTLVYCTVLALHPGLNLSRHPTWLHPVEKSLNDYFMILSLSRKMLHTSVAFRCFFITINVYIRQCSSHIYDIAILVTGLDVEHTYT